MGFTQDNSVLYSQKVPKGLVVFKFSFQGAEVFESRLNKGLSLRSDEMAELFGKMEESGDLSLHFVEAE